MDDIRKRLLLFRDYLMSRKRHQEMMISVIEMDPSIHPSKIENHYMLLEYIDDIIADFQTIVNSGNPEEPII